MSLLMERDFFKYLPSEITTNILSRLPIRSLAVSKSVCKPWLNLIDSDEFHKSEIKTPPALALLTPKGRDATQCAIYEIEDEDEVDLQKSHDLHYISLTDFDIPHPNRGFMEATANGLLLLYPRSTTGCYLKNETSENGRRKWGRSLYLHPGGTTLVDIKLD
ncbi:putative F-box protein At5g36200 isoform X3 [Salvia hispanica]|uniref:putative F-box protein At5g36200 isoform X3 n=1 Tax=Salvia hispanica TaxID=49212 RepID=UPI0020096C93|nr:putative F-box protein At5g36200 isoform X3 [Salvia hispanica]